MLRQPNYGSHGYRSELCWWVPVCNIISLSIVLMREKSFGAMAGLRIHTRTAIILGEHFLNFWELFLAKIYVVFFFFFFSHIIGLFDLRTFGKQLLCSRVQYT